MEQAIQIAVCAHHGQRDKAGQPYILHPLRVMLRMQTNVARIVAVLHDVVEDSDWTLERLRQAGFTPEMVGAVDALTKRPGELYQDAIQRAAENQVARRVKLADLADNLNVARLTTMTQNDAERMARYRQAWEFLAGTAEV